MEKEKKKKKRQQKRQACMSEAAHNNSIQNMDFSGPMTVQASVSSNADVRRSMARGEGVGGVLG